MEKAFRWIKAMIVVCRGSRRSNVHDTLDADHDLAANVLPVGAGKDLVDLK